jgi:hypothetical protein
MPELPQIPTNGDWTGYIIGGIATALVTMWGVVVFLARLIENKYRTEVAELKQELTAVRAESKAEVAAIRADAKQCYEDRTKLFGEVAALNARVTKMEPNKG